MENSNDRKQKWAMFATLGIFVLILGFTFKEILPLSLDSNGAIAKKAASSLPVGASLPGVTTNIGIGLDGFSPYSPLTAYCDATTVMSPWVFPGTNAGDWGANGLYSHNFAGLTSDNYPVSGGDSYSEMNGYPAGAYTVSYTGGGTVTFSGTKYQSLGSWSGTSPRTATLTLGGAGGLNLQVRGDVHNLHIISPESECKSGALFREVFLAKVRPFAAIRFMDWMQTNWSTVNSWDRRSLPTDFSRTKATPARAGLNDAAYTTGMPYEDMIALANQLHKDMWVNVPHMADDTFIKNFADMIRDNLSPDLKVYVEYSNEVWNNTFNYAPQTNEGQWGYVYNKGVADPRVSKADGNDVRIREQEHGLMIKRVADIFKTEFGTARFTSQVYPLFGANIAYDYGAKYALDQVAQSYPNETGTVGFHNIRGVAVAPYAGVSSDMNYIGADNGSVPQLLAGIKQLTDTYLKGWTQNSVNTANAYGLKVFAYEAGQSLQFSNNATNKLAAQTDPGMQAVYKNIFDMWNSVTGNQPIMQFGLVTKYSDYGYWGPFTSLYQTDTPKWDALMQLTGSSFVQTTPPPTQVTCPAGLNQCTPGAQQCNQNGVETCTLNAQNCGVWTRQNTCSGNTLCTLNGAVASCVAPVSECTVGQTQCTGNGVQTCQSVNGVGKWSAVNSCGANTQCSVSNQVASCVAVAPQQPVTVSCPTTNAPVCGSNNQTYSNACNAGNAQTSVAYMGMCQSPRIGDLDLVKKYYGRSDCSAANNYCDGADIDHDGSVGFKELVANAQNFGRKDCSDANDWCAKTDINHDGSVTQSLSGNTTTTTGTQNLTAGLTAVFHNSPTDLTAPVLVNAVVPSVNFWESNPYNQAGYVNFTSISSTLPYLGFSVHFDGKVTPFKDSSGNPMLGTNVYQICSYFSGFQRVTFEGQTLWDQWTVSDPNSPIFNGYSATADCKPVSITENKPYTISADFGKGVLFRLYWRVNGVEQPMTSNLFH